jgi:hypothetical protein
MNSLKYDTTILYHNGIKAIETTRNGIKIWEQRPIKAKRRKLKATWTVELAEELKTIYRIKTEEAKEQLLEDELFEI